MFKKFKNKLAEEMKQSPARLQASMQQLAQAVVSPSLSSNSIQDLSFKDNFSLTEEIDETPKCSPVKHGFETVDLSSSLVNHNNSRRSSVSSDISDTSFFFPIYEAAGNRYHSQSDVNQSTSQIDDISLQLDHVSKEQLYSIYRKVQTKYDKYKTRFNDLITHYHEIEHSKTKLESLLVETQDKALRRISDLKEQCQLEQQAKAHLEDTLRNDIEEKDHVINSLKIKIKLLQEKGTDNENSENIKLSKNHENNGGILVDLSKNIDLENSSEESKIYNENKQLKDKIQKMESFLEKYKDMLKRGKDKILEVTNEKNTLERDYDILQKSNQEKVNSIKKQLHNSKEELKNLKEEIDTLKKREEESVISLAENKLSIHRELEGKEELIKQLQLELKQTLDCETSLKETVETLKQELKIVKPIANQNAEMTQEHLRNKSEALKKMQSEMQQKLIDLEEKMSLKYHEEVYKNKELLRKLQELELQPKVIQYESEELHKVIQELQEKSDLLTKINNEKKECQKLLNDHKSENEYLKKELTKTINALENFKIDNSKKDAYTSSLKINHEKKINELKQEISEKNEMCNESNLKMHKYLEEYEQYKCKLQMQEKEIIILKSNINNELEKMFKLQNELENKNTEVLKLTSELKSCLITITDLKQEINSLITDKNNLIKYLKICKTSFKNLSQDHESFKNYVNHNILNGKHAIFETIQNINKIFSFFNEKKANLKFQINELSETNKIIEELKDSFNDNTTQLEQILNEKTILEKELKDKYNEIEEMKIKIKKFNKLDAKNTAFALEIENLHSKWIELDKLSNEHKQLLYKYELEKVDFLQKISLGKEQHEKILHELNLKASENINLNEELIDLSRKYGEAKEIIQTLKSENKDHNNLIKEIQIFKSKLNLIKQELEEKNNQLKNLQIKSYEEEQQIFELKNKCENYQKMFEENNKKLINFNKELNNSKEVHKKLSIELEEYKNSLQKTMDIKNIVEAELKQEKFKLKTAENELAKSINTNINENEELRKLNLQLITELNNLKSNVNLVDSFKKEKSNVICELDELKLFQNIATNESKSSKDNQNDLLTLNEILKYSQNEIIEQFHNLEKKNKEIASENSIFLKKIESYKYQLQNNNFKTENLTSRLKELEEIKNKNTTLTTILHDPNNYRQTNINLVDEVQKLSKINELTLEIKSLQNKILNLYQYQIKNENFKSELETCKSEIIELENTLCLKNQELASIYSNSQDENHNLKSKLEETNSQIKETKLSTEEKTTKEINRWYEAAHKLENILSNKEFELKILQIKYAKLKENLKNNNEDKLKNKELNESIENVLSEKSKLESQLDETLVTFQAKEIQMQALNEELKNQITKLREQMKMNEEEQNIRLKQVVKEFQAQLHNKEKELQTVLSKRFDQQQNYKSNIVQENEEQLKDFKIKSTKESEQIQRLISDNEQIKKQMQEKVEKLVTNINQIKLEHADEIQNYDKKWKHILKQKIHQLETKHEQEIIELTNEWKNERKSDENTELVNKELENTTRVAMAAVQSNTGSIHTLQQTLLSQKKELVELRKLVKIRQESVEYSTEIEYLRNILYKYMMGKETMVLAKVIAAIVKFDQDQTSKILKKEEDKLSLLGTLGLT